MSEVTSHKSKVKIDKSALEQAIDEAARQPNLTVHSEIVSAVLRYKQLTVVRYKPSVIAKDILEAEIKKMFPEIWEECMKKIN
jgi:hypothetical protein